MTKVDFYTGSSDKLRTACQLCHKAMQHGLQTVVSLPDEASLDAMDKLLWQYPDIAFIPHARSRDEKAEKLPVILSCSDETFPHHDMLISLHEECMPFFSRFERVAEIVGMDDKDSQLGRERFKFYRDRGYELRHFDLNRTQP